MRKWTPQNNCEHDTVIWQDKADEEEQGYVTRRAWSFVAHEDRAGAQ